MKKIIVAVCVAVTMFAGVCFIYSYLNSYVSFNTVAMNTNVSIKIIGPDCKKASDEIIDIITSLENDTLSRQVDTSVVYRLNQNLGGETNDDLKQIVTHLLEISQKSEGKFDFTLGTLSDLWGFGNNPSVPDESEIKKTLSECGYEKIKIDNNKISFPKGLKLDFGATGKGIALDKISPVFEGKKIKEAIISVGGSILVYGKRDFSIGITNPETGSGNVAIITLTGGCISTSGTYERFFEENGKKYHHILDPDTGYPAENQIISVSIISENGTDSDALSTACLVLGKDNGMKLAEEYGCEAVFIDSDHNVYYSSGLEGSIEITDNNYILNNGQ